jgi:hypothetical protein
MIITGMTAMATMTTTIMPITIMMMATNIPAYCSQKIMERLFPHKQNGYLFAARRALYCLPSPNQADS